MWEIAQVAAFIIACVIVGDYLALALLGLWMKWRERRE